MTRKYTKRAPHWTKDQFNTAEVMIRIRSPRGAILSEHTFRLPNPEKVHCVAYYPSGDIEAHGTIPIERYIEELAAIGADRRQERGLDGDQDWEEILASRSQD